MKLRSVLLFAVLLTGCGGSDAAIQAKAGAYYEQAAGTGIVYEVREITSKWNAETQELAIVTRGPVINQQTLNYSRNYCEALGEMRVSTYQIGVNPPLVVDLSQSLQDAAFKIGGVSYIGEGVNQFGNVINPGEAKITASPIAGEVINGSSVVMADCKSKTVIDYAYAWKYRTVAHYDNWRGHSDVWHTGLVETKGPLATYNYTFSKGVGMVAFWYGNKWNADGSVNGLEYFSHP
jgi:hypothetical protein